MMDGTAACRQPRKRLWHTISTRLDCKSRSILHFFPLPQASFLLKSRLFSRSRARTPFPARDTSLHTEPEPSIQCVRRESAFSIPSVCRPGMTDSDYACLLI